MPGHETDFELLREKCGTGNYQVEVAAFLCGMDVVVVIAGGTRYHVGAVALAEPRPSLADPSRISASASVLCVTGHKEDELARDTALKLASSLNRRVAVTAGIHIDEATADELQQLNRNCQQALDKIVLRLRGL